MSKALLINRTILREIAEILIMGTPDHQELSAAIHRYKGLLFELSEIEGTGEDLHSDLYFENGKAIGAWWAALCVEDMRRTQKFIKGLAEAIAHLKTQKDGPIHILYAGCGPFASLLLPILAISSEQDLRLTLIEINKNSVACVGKVFDRLGFNGFLKELLQEDATTYQLSMGEQVDILLSETMQAALREEQQVSVFFNLLRQINNECILIPEKICLSLALGKPSLLPETPHEVAVFKKIAKVFELSEPQLRSTAGQGLWFPEISIDLSGEPLKDYEQLVILTEIQVFRDHWIQVNESGLTVPWIIEDLRNFSQHDCSIKLRYHVDVNPGLVYRFEKK